MGSRFFIPLSIFTHFQLKIQRITQSFMRRMHLRVVNRAKTIAETYARPIIIIRCYQTAARHPP